MDLPFNRDALLPGMRVRNWVIEDVLSVGRGAIVYRASGERTEDVVAIKEYFPADLAVRTSDLEVAAKNPETETPLKLGLRRFAHDMHVLMELTQQERNAGLPQVIDVVKAYGSVHAILALETGTPLSQLLDSGRCFDEAGLIQLVRRVGGGLARLHEAGLRHGAITPRDILIDGPRGPVLLGLGAGEESRVDASVEPSPYAPIERYAPVHPEGPWTDIYGLGAVLRHCVTGVPPADVIDRKGGDALAGTAGLRFSEPFLRAVDAAMETTPQRRPQTVDAWLAMFPSADAPFAARGLRRRGRLPAALAAAGVAGLAAIAWLAGDRASEAPVAPRPAQVAAAPKPPAAASDLRLLDASIERTAAAAARVREISAELKAAEAPQAAVTALQKILADVERDLTDQRMTRGEVAAANSAESAREAAKLFGQVDLRVVSAELAARRAQIAAYEAMTVAKRREQQLAEARAAAAKAEAARPVEVKQAAAPSKRIETARDEPEARPVTDARGFLARADRDIRDIQGDYNRLRRQLERNYGDYGTRADRRAFARTENIYESILDLHGLRRRLARTDSAGTAQRIYHDLTLRRDRIAVEIAKVRRSL